MTKKRLINAAIAVVACMSLCVALAACGTGTVFTSTPFGGDVTFEDLNEEEEGNFNFSFSDGVVDVELESGTVDVEIYDNMASTAEDDTMYIEGDLLKEAKGLKNGDQIRYADDEGSIVVHITGHDATGKINFSEQ